MACQRFAQRYVSLTGWSDVTSHAPGALFRTILKRRRYYDDDERKGNPDRGVPPGRQVHFRVISGWRNLNGPAGNTLIDTIHDLQMGYNEWLMRQPLKEQTFPPDGET